MANRCRSGLRSCIRPRGKAQTVLYDWSRLTYDKVRQTT